MPRYYFHTLNGKMLLDDVGMKLKDLEAAKREAVKYAGNVLKEESPIDMWSGVPWEVKVTDRASLMGQPLLTLTLTAGSKEG